MYNEPQQIELNEEERSKIIFILAISSISYILYKVFQSTIWGLIDLLTLLITLKLKARAVQKKPWSIIDEFVKRVKARPSSTFMCLHDNTNNVTFGGADRMSNQFANLATNRLHLSHKDTIALLMPSTPDYVLLWLGFAKIGVVSGLINNNLTGAPLAHAITTALKNCPPEKRTIVAAPVFLERLYEHSVAAALKSNEITIIPFHTFQELASKESDEITQINASISWDDDIFFIYTSGTTGLPKASKINHLRFYSAGAMMRILSHLTLGDRIYCALPLYHSAGGMVAVSAAIQSGCMIVIRPRFSVRNLLPDIIENGCTVLQYIGDFARFALEAGVQRHKTKLRVAFGNGLRPDVWKKFQNRFDIDRVIEFYGSTEGNANLVNNCGKTGAIGVVPRALSFIYPVCLVKCDRETGEIVRNERGLAVMARVGEPGQLLGLINDKDPSRRFDGYTNREETGKKITGNVKRVGDKWFLSGDLLRSDWFG